MEDRVLHRNLSYEVVGCFYDVYNELGPGHKEKIYHEALKSLFVEKQITFDDNKRLKIMFKGKPIGVYQPDFIVDDKIIVELKAVPKMPRVFERQLYYYLKGTPYTVGYLVNFGTNKIDIKRRVYDSARKHNG